MSATERSPAPSRVRVTPLCVGVGFILVGVAGIIGGVDVDRAWVWVALLTAAGVAGIVGAVQAMRS